MQKDFIVNVNKGGGAVTQRGFASVLVITHEMNAEKPVLIESLTDIKKTKTPETYHVVSALFGQDYKPASVYMVGKEGLAAGDYGELLEEVNVEYFGMTTTDNSTEVIKEVSQLATALEKQYYVTSYDLELKEMNFPDTLVVVHDNEEERPAEGLLVIMTAREATIGGMTAKFKQVKGVSAFGAGKQKLEEIKKNNFNVMTSRLGKTYLAEGVMTDGVFADVSLAAYYMRFRLEEDMLFHFLNTDNVDYTNDGIAEMIDVLETRCNVAKNVQGIFEKYEILYLAKEEIPLNEVAGRNYDYLRVNGTLSGAIHGADMNVYFVL